MEQEGPINFKALRAKFQEEAALAQARNNRPAIAEKPRYLPPPGGHCSSLVSCINTAVENNAPVLPRVIFRDGLRASAGRRPISFPPQPQQTTSPPRERVSGGDGTTRQSLRDRHMPLVLPVLPVREHKPESAAPREPRQGSEPTREAFHPMKVKKKGLLLPFKSTKSSKPAAEGGDEPSYADLTARPASAPGELPSVERQDGVCLEGERPATDGPITPPSAETSGDSESRLMSTLEKAKKKFSRRHFLIYAKPKSCVRAADDTAKAPLSSSYVDGVELCLLPPPPPPPPVCLPHLACVSARPFFKADGAARKSASDKHSVRHSVGLPSLRPPKPTSPPRKPLCDPRMLGPPPLKPPRPPWVDLSAYRSTAVHGREPLEELQGEQPSNTNAVLEAPDFPDFENSVAEPADDGVIDIASLEFEALELTDVPPDFPATAYPPEPPYFEVPETDVPEPGAADSPSFDLQGLDLGARDSTPQDPAAPRVALDLSELPEPVVPERWSQSDDFPTPPPPPPSPPPTVLEWKANQPELGSAEPESFAEEAGLGDHAAPGNGIESQPSASQQGSYYDACDNVYEDVENISKFILSQNSQKRKGGLKNPYADSYAVKDEARLNMWPRNPWGSVAGEHAHSTQAPFHRERQSPDNADHKEQKKREKQRLEKEKKEQKERDKKENEMKKKFKVNGLEEPLYHARVMVASKVRKKHDLPVQSGGVVSIIRTTNCPKGRWLARDADRKYGYISVMNVELNIKEMLELGKKAHAAGKGSNADGDTISIGSRSSNHAILTSSFTDDSEEWACEDETPSPFESHFHQRTVSMPDMLCGHAAARPTLSDANLEDLHTQTQHEALQKLAIFFRHNQDEYGGTDSGAPTPTNAEPPGSLRAAEEPPYLDQEGDFAPLEILPPPPLYADTL